MHGPKEGVCLKERGAVDSPKEKKGPVPGGFLVFVFFRPRVTGYELRHIDLTLSVRAERGNFFF